MNQQHLWHDVTYDIMIWHLISEELASYATTYKTTCNII
jgi:hypothetical protein